MKSVFIAGTIVPRSVAKVYYRPTAWSLGHAHVYGIPGFGAPRIKHSHAELARRINRHVDPIDDLLLGGHSQGGIQAVLLAYARILAGGSGRTYVVTFGAPHKGAPITRLFPYLPAACDMRPGSPFMGEYAEVVEAVAAFLTSVYMKHDGLVPDWSSCVEGANNILVASQADYDAIGDHFGAIRHFPGRGNHLTGVLKRPLTSSIWQGLASGAAGPAQVAHVA